MEEGVFPHNRALTDELQMEEERRLCYVGMTRAERRLYLTSASSRTLWGNVNFNMPSRFLQEIPEELLDHLGGGRNRSVPNYDLDRGRRDRSLEDDASPAVGSAGWGRSQEAARLQQRLDMEPPIPPPAANVFTVGDRVSHSKFGEGVVQDVRGDTITAQFPGHGKRLLVASYLTKL
jgi:DNA helicase II / ATP-dependent DNA helicase PcrA